MPTFTCYVTSGSFTCEADSMEEAEAKYDAYWDGEDICGDNCECSYDDNDVTHIWEGETA